MQFLKFLIGYLLIFGQTLAATFLGVFLVKFLYGDDIQRNSIMTALTLLLLLAAFFWIYITYVIIFNNTEASKKDNETKNQQK